VDIVIDEHEHNGNNGEDSLGEWIDRHPWTLGYIAVVVTVLLIMNLIETF
jgi:hypothetical protein